MPPIHTKEKQIEELYARIQILDAEEVGLFRRLQELNLEIK